MATVLIADAMPIVRSALRSLLADMGHEDVQEAADVPTALTLARQCNPHLVILELALPGPGGLDLLRRLRARDASHKVLVYSQQNPAPWPWPRCHSLTRRARAWRPPGLATTAGRVQWRSACRRSPTAASG